MIDKIKALIKKANELDLDNKFKDADLIDNMIKEAVEVNFDKELSTEHADRWFKERFAAGGTTSYNEDDDVFFYTMPCSSSDLEEKIEEIKKLTIGNKCELDVECSLEKSFWIRNKYIFKNKTELLS